MWNKLYDAVDKSSIVIWWLFRSVTHWTHSARVFIHNVFPRSSATGLWVFHFSGSFADCSSSYFDVFYFNRHRFCNASTRQGRFMHKEVMCRGRTQLAFARSDYFWRWLDWLVREIHVSNSRWEFSVNTRQEAKKQNICFRQHCKGGINVRKNICSSTTLFALFSVLRLTRLNSNVQLCNGISLTFIVHDFSSYHVQMG